MAKNFLSLSDISSYKKAFVLSNYVWHIIIDWEYFPQKTVGLQFVRAIDSISANIAEGFGRYHKKDKINFYYYSLGSVKESVDWNDKAKVRGLLNKKQYINISKELKEMPRELNYLIKFTRNRLTK